MSYVHICIRHQQISLDGEQRIWRYSHEDVTEVVRKMMCPVVITTCPTCENEKKVEKDFLRGKDATANDGA
jgi:hypothetical protein